jgi:hypothetical protein
MHLIWGLAAYRFHFHPCSSSLVFCFFCQLFHLPFKLRSHRQFDRQSLAHHPTKSAKSSMSGPEPSSRTSSRLSILFLDISSHLNLIITSLSSRGSHDQISLTSTGSAYCLSRFSSSRFRLSAFIPPTSVMAHRSPTHRNTVCIWPDLLSPFLSGGPPIFAIHKPSFVSG